MKKIRLTFYKPARDGHYVDNAISSWTKLFNLKAPKELTCGHVALWTPDEDGLFVITAMPARVVVFRCGKSWTSTMRFASTKDNKGGVCVEDASVIYRNPERWFYCEFEVCDDVYEHFIRMMQIDVNHNKGYDKLMILSFFGWRSANDNLKYICSEFCFKHLHVAVDQMWTHLTNRVCNQLKTTMSPLRGAYTLHKCGCDMYNMDNSLLLAGKKY